MSVSSRLKQYCLDNKITYKILEGKGFASQQTISNYLNGTTDPKSEFLERFIKEFRVSANWLMTGEGDSDSGNTDFKENDQVTKVDDSCPCCEKLKAEKMKLLEDLREQQEKYIHLLETGHPKKETSPKSDKKAG